MHALRVLEFDSIRSRLAEHCEIERASSAALNFAPSFDESEVYKWQKQTAQAYALLGAFSVPSLGAVRDNSEAITRGSKGGSIDGATLSQVGRTLASMRAVRSLVEAQRDSFPEIWNFAMNLADLPRLESRLEASLDGGGEVQDSASAELARIRKQKIQAGQRITERIQSYTAGRYRDYLSDPIFTIRDGRYVIPVKAEHKGKVRGIVHDTSATGQTVFVEPEDVLQLGNALRELEAAERAEVARILYELSQEVGAHADEIILGISSAASLDFIFAKARLGYEMNAEAPAKAPPSTICIRKGFHPSLNRDTAVALNIELGLDADAILITGPNTGGKTVAMKTVGLFVAMAQSGLMIPASEARVGHFCQIWADIGDEQSLQQSLSTFSGHIKNIARALREIKPGALVLFDEIGAGTDPAEGAALAKALLLEFQRKGAKILASTHYGELKIFAANAPGFINASMEFDLKTLRPTYRLLMGTPGSSHAMQIAERCGIPREVIETALNDPGVEQRDIALMLEKLEHSKRQAERAQSEADRLTNKLKQVEREAEAKLVEANEARRSAKARVADAFEEELREIRKEAAEIFEELKAGGSTERAREKLRALQIKGEQASTQFREPVSGPARSSDISKGMAVKIDGQGQTGIVVSEPKNGKVNVQIGSLKIEFPVERLMKVEEQRQKREAKRDVRIQKSSSAVMELHLRAMRAELAQEELEKFVDEAILAGLPHIRIVHGKGEGILRDVTRAFLRKHKGIKSFRDGEPAEGGHGVTIAVLE